MTDLADILREIAGRPAVEELAARLAGRRSARLHVAPVIGAARVPLTAALAMLLRRPLLYVVHSGDAALRAHDDMAQWLGPERVLLFPAADALPYEHMSPGPDVLAARLRVLRRLRAEGVPAGYAEERPLQEDDGAVDAESSAFSLQPSAFVIVAPVKALTQPTLTPAELAHATVRLRRGEEISPDALVARLITLGYRPAPTVEEPGELNRRGGILDVFPPGDELPLRIEFFGDEVDSLRRFDPVTQRSEAQAREVTVGPPHEFPLWRRAEALARIRALDVSGLRREARDEWEAAVARLEQGERFEGRALFAPFFYDTTNDQRPTTNDSVEERSSFVVRRSSLLQHLPPGALVALNDATILEQHVADLDQQAEERRALHVEAGELPRSFPRPYLRWDELLAQAGQLALVNLTNNERPADGRSWERYALPEPLFRPAELFGGQLRRMVEDVVQRLATGERVAVVTAQAARIDELVQEALRTGDRRPATGG
ncbi:MAG TPA: hypothetical protein VNL77_03425 [Roseiflexaceae bacterium]|nr:hypothetical protein [Roseiflexaceae bacterium]